MRIKLSGDFGALREFAGQLEKAGHSKALQELSENLAEEALDLVAEGFKGEHDPSGRSWKPKKKPDGRSILVGKTSRLRRGWHRKVANTRGFTIGPAVKYAGYHQFGTRTIPARRMVPKRGRLPSAWKSGFSHVAQTYLRKTFR